MHDAAQPASVGLRNSAVRKPNILLVDDASAIRLVVSASLRTRGYDVTEAATEHAAIAAVEAQGNEIDLVFVDCGAGSRIKEFKLLRLLLEKLPDLPVFISSSDAKTRQAARELCPNAIIVTKPYCIDEVTAHARTLLTPWTHKRPSADDC